MKRIFPDSSLTETTEQLLSIPMARCMVWDKKPLLKSISYKYSKLPTRQKPLKPTGLSEKLVTHEILMAVQIKVATCTVTKFPFEYKENMNIKINDP